MKPSAVRWRVRPCVAMRSVKRCGRRLPTGARSQAPDPGRKKMRRVLVGTAASDTPYGCCFAVGVQSQGAGAAPEHSYKDARGAARGCLRSSALLAVKVLFGFHGLCGPQRATCCFVWFPWATCGTCVATSATAGLPSPPPAPNPRPAAPTRSACHLRPPGLRRQLAEGTYAATLPHCQTQTFVCVLKNRLKVRLL